MPAPSPYRRQSGKPIPPEKRARVSILLSQGLTPRVVAERTGVSESSIRRIRRIGSTEQEAKS